MPQSVRAYNPQQKTQLIALACLKLTSPLTGFRPYLSLKLPQNVLLSIMPRNTIVVTIAC